MSGMSGGMAEAAAAAAAWRAAVDARSGQRYYYNRATRETRWTPPQGWVEEEEEDHGDGSRPEQQQQQQQQQSRRRARGAAGAPLENGTADDEAQDGALRDIREAVDPKSGRVYYYDRKTRQVFWSDPRKAVSPRFIAAASAERAARSQNVSSSSSPRGASAATARLRLDDEQFDREALGSDDEYSGSDDDSGHHEPALSRSSRTNGSGAHSLVENDQADESVDLIEQRLAHLMRAARLEDSADDENLDESDGDAAYDREILSGREPEEAASPSPTFSAREESAPIEQVRSSLALLKRRMQQSKRQPARAREAWQTSSPSRAPPADDSARFVPGEDTDQCTRKTGCTCADCAMGMNGQASAELIACASCGRSFGAKALRVHEPVCNKVFTNSGRKNSGKRETSGERDETRRAAPSSSSGSSLKRTSWRHKSQQLRSALQHKAPSNTLTSTLSTTASSAQADPGMDAEGLVACPHCERTFNPKSAERHIPVCTSIRAKPKKLLRGSGRGAYASSKAASLRREAQSPASDQGLPADAFGRANGLEVPYSSAPGGAGKPASSRRKSMPTSGSLSNRRSVAESGVQLRECPHCYRQFGKKAYDRHLDYCSSLRERNEKLGIPHVAGKARAPRSATAARRQLLHDRANGDPMQQQQHPPRRGSRKQDLADEPGFDAAYEAVYGNAYYDDYAGMYAAEDFVDASEAEPEGNENLNPYYYGTPYEFVEERDSLRVQLQNM